MYLVCGRGTKNIAATSVGRSVGIVAAAGIVLAGLGVAPHNAVQLPVRTV